MHKTTSWLAMAALAGFSFLSGIETDQITEKAVLNLTVYNPSEFVRVDEDFLISFKLLDEGIHHFNPDHCIVKSAGKELPTQKIDQDQDGFPDHFLVICDFEPMESKAMTVVQDPQLSRSKFRKRAQAELSVKEGGQFIDRVYHGGHFKNIQSLVVPPEHTDHSFYIRYEGPGWESDKIGYRLYLDWRNAIDIFGKKTSSLVLQDVGQDGFDSYHEMSDWGMDILKVGESLGIGSFGMWHQGRVHRVSQTETVSCKIASDGPLEAAILTDYSGWTVADHKYDLSSLLSIRAGSRLTKNVLQISPPGDNLCTGIVKHPDVTLITHPAGHGEWNYLATYGSQSLAGDHLGMAIIYREEQLLRKTEDDHSWVLVLSPSDGHLTYYFLAAWEGEVEGIKNVAEFSQYLVRILDGLNRPVTILTSE